MGLFYSFRYQLQSCLLLKLTSRWAVSNIFFHTLFSCQSCTYCNGVKQCNRFKFKLVVNWPRGTWIRRTGRRGACRSLCRTWRPDIQSDAFLQPEAVAQHVLLGLSRVSPWLSPTQRTLSCTVWLFLSALLGKAASSTPRTSSWIFQRPVKKYYYILFELWPYRQLKSLQSEFGERLFFF